jgi:hypothetical protein
MDNINLPSTVTGRTAIIVGVGLVALFIAYVYFFGGSTVDAVVKTFAPN